jgi:hypothetical protein
MNGTSLTSAELVIWRMIARDLGYEIDEVGHPFRRGQTHDHITGEEFNGVLDWSPLEFNDDAFMLQFQYQLTMVVSDGSVLVHSTIPTIWHQSIREEAHGDFQQAARRALFLAAGEIVKRRAELDDIAS